MHNRWRFAQLIILFLVVSCNRINAFRPVKFQQYYAEGEVLYVKHCSNCHQKTGEGLGLVYPPLNRSDYLEKNFTGVLCQMKFGKAGETIVNGDSFNKPMPGIPSLTELEIAEIATYLYNTWGREHEIVEVAEVQAALGKCNP